MSLVKIIFTDSSVEYSAYLSSTSLVCGVDKILNPTNNQINGIQWGLSVKMMSPLPNQSVQTIIKEVTENWQKFNDLITDIPQDKLWKQYGYHYLYARNYCPKACNYLKQEYEQNKKLTDNQQILLQILRSSFSLFYDNNQIVSPFTSFPN